MTDKLPREEELSLLVNMTYIALKETYGDVVSLLEVSLNKLKDSLNAAERAHLKKLLEVFSVAFLGEYKDKVRELAAVYHLFNFIPEEDAKGLLTKLMPKKDG